MGRSAVYTSCSFFVTVLPTFLLPMLTRVAPVVVKRKPDIVPVYGDVNSTTATLLLCTNLKC